MCADRSIEENNTEYISETSSKKRGKKTIIHNKIFVMTKSSTHRNGGNIRTIFSKSSTFTRKRNVPIECSSENEQRRKFEKSNAKESNKFGTQNVNLFILLRDLLNEAQTPYP